MQNATPSQGISSPTLLIALAVTLTMLVATFPEYALGTVVPFVERDGPLNARTVGIYTSVMFLPAGTISVITGNLVDRYPVIPLNVFLFLAVGCVMIGLPALSTGTHFILFSIVAGGFLALSNPLTNRIIRANVPFQNRPWVVGWKSIGPQLGALVAGLVYAFSGSAWREASYGSALIFFAMAAVFGAFLGRLLTGDATAPAAAATGDATIGLPESSVVYWLVLFSFFSSGAIDTVGAYVPVYAHEILGFSPDAAAMAAVVAAVATIVGRAIWVGACRRFLAIRLLIVASLLASVSSIGLMVAPFVHELVFWFSLTAMGLTALGMAPLVQVIVIEAVDLSRIGRASALIGVGMYGGFAAQPVFMLEIMKIVGFANSWGVLAASNLVGVAVLLLYGRSRARGPRASRRAGVVRQAAATKAAKRG